MKKALILAAMSAGAFAPHAAEAAVVANYNFGNVTGSANNWTYNFSRASATTGVNYTVGPVLFPTTTGLSTATGNSNNTGGSGPMGSYGNGVASTTFGHGYGAPTSMTLVGSASDGFSTSTVSHTGTSTAATVATNGTPSPAFFVRSTVIGNSDSAITYNNPADTTNADFLSFTVVPASGFKLNLTSVTLDMALVSPGTSSVIGTTNVAGMAGNVGLRSSLDADASSLSTASSVYNVPGTGQSQSSWTNLTLNMTGHSSITDTVNGVTFRIGTFGTLFGAGNAPLTSTSGVNGVIRLDNISLVGTVDPVGGNTTPVINSGGGQATVTGTDVVLTSNTESLLKATVDFGSLPVGSTRAFDLFVPVSDDTSLVLASAVLASLPSDVALNGSITTVTGGFNIPLLMTRSALGSLDPLPGLATFTYTDASSANDSINIQFAAIPEPASASVMVAAGLVTLLRRRTSALS
jgi:hypothetical protein